MADPYTTLGVARGATEADIKKAYRKLAKELHPDKNKDNPKATERFSTVTQAYDLLSDKDKRARFDRGEIDGDGNPAAPFGYGGGGGGFRGQPGGFEQQGGADFGDIFEGLFGGRRGGGGFGGRAAPPPKGANIGYRLAVSFEDAASLAPQRITLGDGKTIDLKLPSGVETGTQMRLGGKGEPGPGGPGDAVVTIEISNHRFFKRDGDAVRLDLPVTIAEAVLGGPVKVPTVDGPVMLNIPAASSSGKVLRLKGRGFTGKTGLRGDQLVTLMISVPAADDPTTEALKTWSESARENLGNPRAGLGV
ncbi:J domain-containing protein [Sphingomonas paeninsulae]|uniref:J domain-containing protein n=1 Tax=Sphingomonas paeninsulae TaxID=2319844 RepID=A0A494TB54_SPHPE|nr:DnaJ C-terminal domain-containing protein [Sphingomonas paeninsulae]AYJ86320.1 J domain-containing protein [Sphingomonas paeninsulae]